LVKARAYGGSGDDAAASALLALRTALSTLLRLFAPFLPFVTEEVWSWWQPASIHRAPWPDSASLRAAAGDTDPLVRDVAAAVLTAIRKAKSDAKVGMRADVAKACVYAPGPQLEALWLAADDITAAGKVAALDTEVAPAFRVAVTLAPPT
ncbi:MAG: class I tRNA ligase family protein, partial [Acidimicrobiales bacterium]